jgi:hypothetical protein
MYPLENQELPGQIGFVRENLGTAEINGRPPPGQLFASIAKILLYRDQKLRGKNRGALRNSEIDKAEIRNKTELRVETGTGRRI